jgi:hypothetical protein
MRDREIESVSERDRESEGIKKKERTKEREKKSTFYLYLPILRRILLSIWPVLTTKHWGLRPLTYPIERERENVSE